MNLTKEQRFMIARDKVEQKGMNFDQLKTEYFMYKVDQGIEDSVPFYEWLEERVDN